MASSQNPRLLNIPFLHEIPFVYVDCGARDGIGEATILEAFPQAQLIGFEPDAEECDRLNRTQTNAGGRHQQVFYPVAVGARQEERCLYITKNLACSSLYRPNNAVFGKFLDCADAIEVIRETSVATVALDAYLPSIGVERIDFLKLDVQGAELDVLQGAKELLTSCVLGLRLEVEFAQLYQGQPLFGDVDAYLRQSGFVLFDLSRTRYRREVTPRDLPTRGQLLWGDAIYLRDYEHFLDPAQTAPCLQLAVLASALGFHDYAMEIVNVLADTPTVSASERVALKQEQVRYTNALLQPTGHAEKLYRWMTSSRRLRPVSNRLFLLGWRLLDIRRAKTEQSQFCWFD